MSLQWTRIMTSCTVSDLGKKLCVFVYKSVCLRIPTKWFLLEGRQTAIETVVWHSWKRGERARVRDRTGKRGGWWGGKVDCASVHPSSSFPKLGENKKDIKNAKEQVKPLFPLVVCSGLPQLNIKTICPFVCLLSLTNKLRSLKSAWIDSCL